MQIRSFTATPAQKTVEVTFVLQPNIGSRKMELTTEFEVTSNINRRIYRLVLELEKELQKRFEEEVEFGPEYRIDSDGAVKYMPMAARVVAEAAREDALNKRLRSGPQEVRTSAARC